MKSKILALALIAATTVSVRAVPADINALGTPYTQNFDTLASSGTNNPNATLPLGWASAEANSFANSNYRAGTGSSTTGDTYSFGSAGSAERALGGLLSANLIPLFGVELRNNTASLITALAIAYTGEQWRLGALGRVDQIDFQYSLNASSLTSGLWNDVNALDFTAPTTVGTVGALDGNASANRAAISGSISGLTLASGSTIWFRWTDFDATGSDDGLAVDDFSVTASGPSAVPDSLPFGFAVATLLGVLILSRRIAPAC